MYDLHDDPRDPISGGPSIFQVRIGSGEACRLVMKPIFLSPSISIVTRPHRFLCAKARGALRFRLTLHRISTQLFVYVACRLPDNVEALGGRPRTKAKHFRFRPYTIFSSRVEAKTNYHRKISLAKMKASYTRAFAHKIDVVLVTMLIEGDKKIGFITSRQTSPEPMRT